MKTRLIAILLLCSLHALAQQGVPPGAYGPGSSSTAGSGGIPFVTSGVTADCQLLETSGTTVNCGTAGNGTLGAGTAAPAFPSITGLGTAQAMDNFTNAALTTAGNWVANTGTFTVTAGAVSAATLGGPNSNATAGYTGLPVNYGQQATFHRVTIKTAPTGSSNGGPGIGVSSTAETGYFCVNTTTILFLIRDVAGSFTTTTLARVPANGDIATITITRSASLTGATIACNWQAANGTNSVTVTLSDPNPIVGGGPGIYFGGSAVGSPALSNSISGVADTNSSGGLLFGGGQNVLLPASLNSSQTVEVFACYQNASQANTDNALLIGNGNGAASNANGIDLSGQGTSFTLAGHTPHAYVIGGSAIATAQVGALNGCGMVTVIYGTAPALDRVFINAQESGTYANSLRGSSAGLQTVGQYLLGGAPAGSGLSGASFFTGTIYRVRTFSRAITPSEVVQDSNAMSQAMIGRGVTPYLASTSNCDAAVIEGDSQSSGAGLTTPATQAFGQLVTLFSPANINPYCNAGLLFNSAVGGNSAGASQAPVTAAGSVFGQQDVLCNPYFTGNGTRNTCVIWMGTNDLFFQSNTGVGSGTLMADIANYTRALHNSGWKVIFVDVITRGTTGACQQDPNKDAFNPLARSLWPKIFDGFVDLASDPAFADGQCGSTSMQGDFIHPSIFGQADQIAPRIQYAINALWAPKDFSSPLVNTYTATSTAATATTAGTSAAQIATITMAATQPWAKGQCVVVAGVTPAGYNTAANQCAFVLSSSSTQITYTTSGSNIGPITVQGTVQGPQELDQDVYAILGGAAAGPNHILETCLGRIGSTVYREITNTNATPWTITSTLGETINGGATFTTPVASATNHPVIALKSILTSNTAGGCTWQASLQ